MIKSKRVMALAVVASLGLVAAACGDDKDSGTAVETTAAGETTVASEPTTDGGDFMAGIAFDTGGRGDGTFNDSAAAGGDKAKTDLGIELKELEATVDEDRKHAIEADKRMRLVTVFGGKLTDCLNVGEEVAAEVEKLGVPLERDLKNWYGEPAAATRADFYRQAKLIRLDSLRTKPDVEPLSDRLWRRYGRMLRPLACAITAVAYSLPWLTMAIIYTV